MRRREFIAALGGAAAWPMVARAQKPERMRRIGVLMNRAVDNPEGHDRLAVFHQGLQDVSKYPDDAEVPWFATKVVCAKCGSARSAHRRASELERATGARKLHRQAVAVIA